MSDGPARNPAHRNAGPGFLLGGGECARLIAERDWAVTALGPIEDWTPSLKTATAILLRSPVPIVMLWGEQGVMIYNDAYSAFAGGRHPQLLGSRVREGWPEVADFNHNVMDVGLAGGTLHYHDQELTLYRHGRPEQVWMDLDYSPVLNENGIPGGVICILADTTERVAAERRTAFLLSLSDALRPLDTPAAITSLAAARLGEWLDASRVFYAEIAGGRITVAQDHARGVPSIVGEHSLEAFGPDLLDADRAGAPVVVRDVGADERLSEEARAGLIARHVGAFIDVILFEETGCVGLLALQSAKPRLWTVAEGLARGHYVRLSVGDTGSGMDADTVKRSVEPFFSTKGVGKGTGLGLSMVHGLTAQLGGGLTIESMPGEGTTVSLWLPISAMAVSGEDRSLEPSHATGSLGTALLIDDEDLVRMSTAEMLADLSYEVVEAGSAEEALRLIQAGLEPDILVTDHLMPGMTGAQLARELKATRPNLPVLIVSGYAEEAGIDPDIPRLTKPFRNAELAASLSALSIGG